MKIVQVTAVDETMNNLLRELNEQTIEAAHELICICSDGPRVQGMRDEGFDVRTINIDRKLNISRNLKSIKDMYQLLKKEKPDIVHVHTPIAGVLGRVAAKLAKVPTVIYTAHGFYFHENMTKSTYNLFYWIEKISAKLFTDYIFTQSQEDGDLATNKNFLPPGRINVISNGIDVTEKFNPKTIEKKNIDKIKNEFGIKNTDKVITFVGRLVKEKGIFDFLEAIKKIEAQHYKVLIIGGDNVSTERDQVTHKKIEEFKVDENVIFTGSRTDIPELLHITDIFCLPSYREGMPRSILEAMSMECAIVATDIRGSREEIDHNINGLLTPLGSVKSLSRAINTLLNDEKKLKKYKLNAREKAVNLYDENKVVKKQLKIFNDIEKRG